MASSAVIPPERVKAILAELRQADPAMIRSLQPKPSLAERVETRVRAEWPGVKLNPIHGRMEVPEIREGGSTDQLVKLMAEILKQEQEKTPWMS